MRKLLMMKIYAAIAIAILGVRIAFETLSVIELVQFFGTAITISLVATGLHLFFENRAHKTGKNGVNSPNFLVSMIVITILASTGLYILISYIYSNEFNIGFEIIFYALFLPAVILISIWMYTQILETEYNKRLIDIQNKNRQ